jgi:hypothetical protein
MIRPILLAALLPLSSLFAAEGRVIKVLPHLLDAKGRHTLSPSLYERDAYQARLRADPSLAHGLRFDVLWKISKAGAKPLTLRIELRGANGTTPMTVEREVKRGFLGRRWSGIELDSEDFRKVGMVSAWRASLREGDSEIASTSSFLW